VSSELWIQRLPILTIQKQNCIPMIATLFLCRNDSIKTSQSSSEDDLATYLVLKGISEKWCLGAQPQGMAELLKSPDRRGMIRLPSSRSPNGRSLCPISKTAPENISKLSETK
jgi:hypothetical protein